MKHLQTFENYHDSYLNEILDKINSTGMNSLTKIESDFLQAYSKSDEVKMKSIEREKAQKKFVSSDKYFEFQFSHSEETGHEDDCKYWGKITVPDLELEDGRKISGELSGYIWSIEGGKVIVPVFEKGEWEILEFCNGLEYELDSFLDYVVSSIKDEKLA